MEAGFAPGTSPLGEDCPGWAVAVGWQAFLAPGDPASSCLNENKNPANTKSGERSQEITFDFISAEAGIYRQAETIPGYRYRIEAWGKHIRSESPVELSLGVDLTGGEDWQAATVTWTPWDEPGEDVWMHTQVTVRASGGARMWRPGSRMIRTTALSWIAIRTRSPWSSTPRPFVWDEGRRARLRAELDALYGHLYGLTREELAYILDTFPIVRRKDEVQYREYRTKRMVLERYEEQEGQFA
jgi:hypothetical protein